MAAEEEYLDFFQSTVDPLVVNSSWNSTGGNVTSEENFFEFYQTEQIIFLCVLFILILIGNVSVLGAILMSKNRKSRMNFFIMHLAIADLLTGFVVVLTDIIWKSIVAWYGTNVGCKILKFLQSTVTYGSTYVLVALSVDRVDAIARPMSFSRSGLRSKILIVSAWILSTVFSIPMLILNEETTIRNVPMCWMLLPKKWHWKLLVVFHTVFVFLLPTVIIAFCYCIIVFIIWSKSPLEVEPKKVCTFKSLGNKTKRCSANRSDVTALNGTSAQRNTGTSSRGLIPKARVKTIKMTFVIVLVFVVCWSPYFVFGLLEVFGHLPESEDKTAVSIFIQSLASLNAAANPIIYCLFSTKICDNWRRISCIDWLIKKLRCCNKKQPPPHQTTLTSEYTLVDTNLHAVSPKAKRPNHGHPRNVPIGGSNPGGTSEHGTLLKTVVLPESNQVIRYNVRKNGKKFSENDKKPVLLEVV